MKTSDKYAIAVAVPGGLLLGALTHMGILAPAWAAAIACVSGVLGGLHNGMARNSDDPDEDGEAGEVMAE